MKKKYLEDEVDVPEEKKREALKEALEGAEEFVFIGARVKEGNELEFHTVMSVSESFAPAWLDIFTAAVGELCNKFPSTVLPHLALKAMEAATDMKPLPPSEKEILH